MICTATQALARRVARSASTQAHPSQNASVWEPSLQSSAPVKHNAAPTVQVKLEITPPTVESVTKATTSPAVKKVTNFNKTVTDKAITDKTITSPAVQTTTTTTIIKHTPWPFSLPSFLQPKAGTTYYEQYAEFQKEVKVVIPASFLQRVLYGNLEPGKRQVMQLSMQVQSQQQCQVTLWHKILCGVPEPGPLFGGSRKKIGEVRNAVTVKKERAFQKGEEVVKGFDVLAK